MLMKTRTELEAELIARVADDDTFRSRLLENPREVIQEAVGVAIPEDFTIQVHEENSMAAHIVLAAQRPVDRGGTGVDCRWQWSHILLVAKDVMPEKFRDIVPELQPFVPRSLIDGRGWERLLDRVGGLPGWATAAGVGFEFRLIGDARADFAVAVAPGSPCSNST